MVLLTNILNVSEVQFKQLFNLRAKMLLRVIFDFSTTPWEWEGTNKN